MIVDSAELPHLLDELRSMEEMRGDRPRMSAVTIFHVKTLWPKPEYL